jgi:hypothetical protein
VLVLACLAASAVRAAEAPLSKDDVTLLLIGGANAEKMLDLIERRGVDFQMTPDLAKQFQDRGASDEVIEAIQRAAKKAAVPTSSPAAPPKPPSEVTGGSAPADQPSNSAATQPARSPRAASTVQQRVNETLAEKDEPISDDGSGPSRTSKPAARAQIKQTVDLKDPSPPEIERIIQEFATKEKMFKEARDNYTFHQINKVDELGPNDIVVGTYRQDWDILFDDSGKRIEQVTYAPLPTLKGLMVTKEDLDAMRSIQPFVLTVDELPEYDIKYLGHVRVDELTTYVFSVRPKEIKKNRLYFKGIVWVDDRDLQIVKTEGKSVPETRTKQGENLFPRFITYREQIDGKYWFPTFTMADDTLYFPAGAIHIKEVIRYTDYKQFKSKVRILSSTPTDETGAAPTDPKAKKKP